jgi:hypothetical protein
MRGLQAPITDGPAGCEAYMYDRRPAFELVMVVVMKNIRNADGEAGAARFDGSEGGVVIDQIVGQQGFLASAAAEIQGGEIVERAGSAYAREKPIVFLVPEMMGARGGLAGGGPGFRRLAWRCVGRCGESGLRLGQGWSEKCQEGEGCFWEMFCDALLLHVCSFVARWRLDLAKLRSAL